MQIGLVLQNNIWHVLARYTAIIDWVTVIIEYQPRFQLVPEDIINFGRRGFQIPSLLDHVFL